MSSLNFLVALCASLCTLVVHAFAFGLLDEPNEIKATQGNSGTVSTRIHVSAKIASEDLSNNRATPKMPSKAQLEISKKAKLERPKAKSEPNVSSHQSITRPNQSLSVENKQALVATPKSKPTLLKETVKNDKNISQEHASTVQVTENEKHELPFSNASKKELRPDNAAMAKVGSQQSINANNQFTNALLKRLANHKHYPFKSRLRKEQGVVHVSFTLSVKGELTALAVKKSSGFVRLDEAALKMFRAAFPLPEELQSYIQLVGNNFTLPIAFNLSQFND